MDQTQLLINLFEAFQPFAKVETKEQFYSLLSDPAGEFDKAIVAASNIKAGELSADAEAVASMFGLERSQYMNLIKGRAINTGSCKPCQNLKIRIGQPAISLLQFRQFEKYIDFTDGELKFNLDNVQAKKESFVIRATSDYAIEHYKFWENVCNVLNNLNSKGYLGQTEMLSLQDSLQRRVMFSYATSKLHLNHDYLINEILQLQ